MPDSPGGAESEREAFERGRRRAVVDAELEAHEKRLNAINGTIERHAREVAALVRSIDVVSDKVDSVIAKLATRDAVEEERDRQLKRANEQQISARTFWLGVAAIVATIVAAYIGSKGGVL